MSELTPLAKIGAFVVIGVGVFIVYTALKEVYLARWGKR